MSKDKYFRLDASQTRRNAMIDALRAPCYALCVTMAGFSSIARESGFDFMMTLVTSLGVWGMPGQVAFASLYSAGASLFIIFVAVSLANMRMLLMVISAADMMLILAIFGWPDVRDPSGFLSSVKIMFSSKVYWARRPLV